MAAAENVCEARFKISVIGFSFDARGKNGPARRLVSARDSKPQALPVHPWSERHGFLRDRLGGAQILGSRLARAAVGNDIEADVLSLVEGAHTRAFDRADMDENVFAPVCRLNEAKALLAVKPLHNSLIHRDVLLLTVYTWALAYDLSWPLPGLVDFGEVSETCAPVSNEAKRPSCSANYRFLQHMHGLSRLQDRGKCPLMAVSGRAMASAYLMAMVPGKRK
jgi:hypothetical protein